MKEIHVDAADMVPTTTEVLEENRWELSREMWQAHRRTEGVFDDAPGDLLSDEKFLEIYEAFRSAQDKVDNYDTYLGSLALNAVCTLLSTRLVALREPPAEEGEDAVEMVVLFLAQGLREELKTSLACALTDMNTIPDNETMSHPSFAAVRQVHIGTRPV